MTAPRPPLDPEIARILRAAGLSRRRLLRGAAVGGGALLTSGLLAACGIGNDNGATTAGPSPSPTAGGGGGAATDRLVIANWPLYIDVGEDETTSATLEQFRSETGIDLEYLEEVNSNDEWFARFRTQLDAGQDIGRDITVLTDWMAGRMIELGWTEPIDAANVPNKDNILPALADVAFDPGRQRSLTWQSGLTGIGYNPELTGRELSSIEDLFDPEFAGRVTFLSEMRDTMGLVMATLGSNPSDHLFSEFEAAIERLQEATDSGQIRAFTGNEYANDLAAGNIVACTAWSGDIIQLQFDNPDLRFVIPSDGGVLWSDNMLIPANAANKANAERFMDFVYQPEVAAQIAAWVNYISPVQGAQEAMQDVDPELAEDELIFPSEETLSNTFEFMALDEGTEAEYQRLFQSVIGA
ncbi:MAG TPA: spermidine/putrescine ABC transporter substrate-binding protein [Euzebya sp.]|nr:spermidine/putrescine ABC transporter substrate-binding protein [Euzebya sp.]